MGECGANLPSSSRQSDHGDWSCYMGIDDGADVMTKVSVIVTGIKLLFASLNNFNLYELSYLISYCLNTI